LRTRRKFRIDRYFHPSVYLPPTAIGIIIADGTYQSALLVQIDRSLGWLGHRSSGHGVGVAARLMEIGGGLHETVLVEEQ
jgi:hypothetical protein